MSYYLVCVSKKKHLKCIFTSSSEQSLGLASWRRFYSGTVTSESQLRDLASEFVSSVELPIKLWDLKQNALCFDEPWSLFHSFTRCAVFEEGKKKHELGFLRI